MAAPGASRLSATDYGLVFLLLLGIYLEVAIYLTPSVPIPSVLAGAAGLVLIWRRRDDFTSKQLAAFLAIILILAVACFAAPDWTFLAKRLTGLIQLSYSLIIGFALFLTLRQASRPVLSTLLLSMCFAILVGAQLEAIPAFREMSDSVRQVLYRSGVYESDLRDLLFYGKVRPKVFTSEPSAVTFAFSLFSFAWFLATPSRHRFLIFAALLAASLIIIPGPTTLIAGIAAGASYFLLPARNGRQGISRLGLAIVAVVGMTILLAAGSVLFSERLEAVMSGRDPSFFYRVIGPALVAQAVLVEHPLTGIGLTAEQFAADLAMNVFVQSDHYSSAWRFDKFSEVLTNYFWLHWIYLGGVFGTLMLVAVSFWMRSLGVRSLTYCWLVWFLFGQASGAYVGPKTWVVLLMTAALAFPVLQHRAVAGRSRQQPRYRLTGGGLVQLPYRRNPQ